MPGIIIWYIFSKFYCTTSICLIKHDTSLGLSWSSPLPTHPTPHNCPIFQSSLVFLAELSTIRSLRPVLLHVKPHLWCQHHIRALVHILAAATADGLEKQQKQAQVLGTLPPSRSPGWNTRLSPGPAPATAVTWGVNQETKRFSLRLHLLISM